MIRKMALIEIADTLKISKPEVGHIVQKRLSMHKLQKNWVTTELPIG